MKNQRSPKLFDLIVVLNPPAGSEVEIGDVGTAVELLPPDGVEVEFLKPEGHTRSIETFSFSDVLVLNRDRTHVA